MPPAYGCAAPPPSSRRWAKERLRRLSGGQIRLMTEPRACEFCDEPAQGQDEVGFFVCRRHRYPVPAT